MRRLRLSADLKACYQTLLPAADVGWWTRLQALHGAVARYAALSIDAMRWSADELDANIPEFAVDPAWSPLERYERIRRLAADAAGRVREYYADYQAARERLLTIAPAVAGLLPSVFHVLEGHLSALEAAERAWQAVGLMADAKTCKPSRLRIAEETDMLVGEYLIDHKDRWNELTIREVSEAISVPKSTIQRTPAWRAFVRERKKRRDRGQYWP